MKKINKFGIFCLIFISCALVVTSVSADTSGVLNPLTSSSESSGVLNPLTSSSSESSGVLNPLTSSSESSGVLNPLTSFSESSGVLNPLTSSSNSSGVLNPLTSSSSESSGVLNPLTSSSNSSGVLNPLTSSSESSDVLNQTSVNDLSPQNQTSNITGETSETIGSYGVVITENRLQLAKGEYSQHLIRFDNDGQVTVQALEGATFDLYSKKGESWPDSSTFKTSYDQTMKVTSLNPAVMEVGPGIWVFTIDSPDQDGAYSLAAFQNAEENQQTVSQSSDLPLRPGISGESSAITDLSS